MTPPESDAGRGAVRARLATAQGDPEIGTERIAVYHDDGRVEEVALHDYARVYALPGVYEQIVQEDLGCRSPEVVAEMLGSALDGLGRARHAVRVIDVAAGNGVSGEALAAAGITGLVLGTDIVPEARTATLRDRPGLYGDYRILDLTRLTETERAEIAGLGADVLTCVAPVGAGGLPAEAIGALVGPLAGDAVLVALHDPRSAGPDPLDEPFFAAHGRDATLLERRTYLHRFLITGAPYELTASAWRLEAVGSTVLA